MDWFLYCRDLCHVRVKYIFAVCLNFRLESSKLSGGESLTSYIRQENLKKMKRKAGLSSSFTPGLLKNNANCNVHTIKKIVKIYEKVLHECGFEDSISWSNRAAPATWKISIPVSTTFQTAAHLNDKKEIVVLTERPLHWIHDTLISGKKHIFKHSILTNPDMRISISSTETVEEDTDLYNKSLTKISKGLYDLPITIDEKNVPKLKNEKCKISNVRHTECSRTYVSGNKMHASINCGKNFSMGLHKGKPFCELWLFADAVDLQQAITKSLGESSVETFAKNVFYTSLKVKKKLEEILSNIDDVDHEVIHFCF